MRKHDVPKDMQVRVQRWCDYAWTRGRMQGALDINSLQMLPDRLKTELALHVHLDILKQVSISSPAFYVLVQVHFLVGFQYEWF